MLMLGGNKKKNETPTYFKALRVRMLMLLPKMLKQTRGSSHIKIIKS